MCNSDNRGVVCVRDNWCVPSSKKFAASASFLSQARYACAACCWSKPNATNRLTERIRENGKGEKRLTESNRIGWGGVRVD